MLLRKLADMEVEEGTTTCPCCCMQVLFLVPDSKLQQLESGELDQELLVDCIRISPSPHTR